MQYRTKTPITMQKASAGPHRGRETKPAENRNGKTHSVLCRVNRTVVCERSMKKQGGCYPCANAIHKLLLMCETPI